MRQVIMTKRKKMNRKENSTNKRKAEPHVREPIRLSRKFFNRHSSQIVKA